MRYLKHLFLIIPITFIFFQSNAQEENKLKFYAEAGIQRDFFKNGYKYSDETFTDIYPWFGQKVGYNCNRNIGPYFSFSTSYKIWDFMDVNLGINYFIFNMHYRQNSIDTLKKYYPDVITEDEDFFKIKHNYRNNIYLTLGPSFKIWRLQISPSVDFYLGMIDYWNVERFNDEELNEFGFDIIPSHRSSIRIGFKLGYEFKMYDRNFVVNAGFITDNLLLTIKMEV